MEKNLSEKQKPSSQFQRSSLSVRAVVILLVTILLLGSAGVVMLKYASFSQVHLSVAKKSSALNDVNKKIASANNNGQSLVTLTEEEVNTIIAENKEFPLRNAKIKIYSDRMTVVGKIGSKYLPVSTEVGVVPKAENGKIKYDIVSIKTGGIEAPQKIRDAVNSELGSNLDAIFSGFDYTYKIESIVLREGFVDIYGQKAA